MQEWVRLAEWGRCYTTEILVASSPRTSIFATTVGPVRRGTRTRRCVGDLGRQELPRAEDDFPPDPSSVERRLPTTITAGDSTRTVSNHLRRERAQERPYATAVNIAHVLDQWIFRCVARQQGGRESRTYWGSIRHGGKSYLMRVGVSMDDEIIATAYIDSMATRKWLAGDLSWFRHKCLGDVEERL